MNTDEYTISNLPRFWSKVDRREADDCWIWKGATASKSHYGIISWRAKPVYAHRLSYEIAFGDPGTLDVLHKCDNPRCVNPVHLFLGTQQDNMTDKVHKGRSLAGERHNMAKLTSERVDELRRLRQEGRTINALKKEFGISYSQIYRILNFENWNK